MNEFLREAMRVRGWSTPRLAEACDVAVGLAQRWVSDNPRYRVNPSPSSCRKIANALGVNPDFVLGLAGHREGSADALNPEVAGIVAVWDGLSEARREGIKILAGLAPHFSANSSREGDSTGDKIYQIVKAGASSFPKAEAPVRGVPAFALAGV